MPDQAKDIAKIATVIAGDPNGDYTKEALYIPLLQLVEDDLVNEIYANPNMTRLKLAVVLPNVPAGTTELSKYFEPGNSPSLALLKDILSFREKPAGFPDQAYQTVTQVDDLPVQQQVGYNGQMVWTGDNILLPGANQSLDFRVWGLFDPQPLKDGESPTIPNARICLEWGLAAAISEAHGNDSKVQRFEAKYDRAKQQLFTNIMMEMQFEVSRQRSFGELSGTTY